jgi:hypothetical protein
MVCTKWYKNHLKLRLTALLFDPRRRALTQPVCKNNAWLSFYLQLFPALSWGLVTVCIPLKKLDTKSQWVYEKALPFLHVNCKIKQEWRTLPEQYQGLGMPIMPLLALLVKLSFLLSNWGFMGQAHSKALAMAYDDFLLEVGLYGSPLQWQYEEYGTLLTDATWFHNLWQLVSLCGAEVCFRSKDMITRIRENDCSLTAKFYQVGYQGKHLESLNIMRRFRNLLHLSDISKCDGITLDEFVISDMAEESA